MKAKKLSSLILGAALLFTLLAGCSSAGKASVSASPSPSASSAAASTSPTGQVTLNISAASSLTDVMNEIAKAYKSVAPNVNLTFSFNSSGTLQTQIEQGAPADVFFSAAAKQMNALKDKGLTDNTTIRNLLTNKVVLIVPKGAKANIKTFQDVSTSKVKMVGIGDSTVPVGQYTQDIYTKLGLWDKVKAKANLASNVRQVLSWVETGSVDCGIVYATDAKTTDKVTVVTEAPAGSSKPVVYPAAVLKNSKNPTEAKAFLDFLSSDTAATIFKNAGFTMYTK